jgi:hypothetical protein
MPAMHRRHFMVLPVSLFTGVAMPQSSSGQRVRSLDDVLHWLDALEQGPAPRTTGAWPLATVLDHLAQSVEMSMRGFPQPKSALFQLTAGAAAFAIFKWRGAMSHGLNEPIPGAPVLATSGDWKVPAGRLRQAVVSFNAWQGPLQPHFAYGALSKADFALAHSFHVANHQDEILTG